MTFSEFMELIAKHLPRFNDACDTFFDYAPRIVSFPVGVVLFVLSLIAYVLTAGTRYFFIPPVWSDKTNPYGPGGGKTGL